MQRARLAVIAPDLASGLRAAVATIVPFYAAIALGRPDLTWVALGGWLGSIADPGGSRSGRALAMLAFTGLGGAAVMFGLAASPHVVAAAIVLGVMAFAASMARPLGAGAAGVGTLIAIATAIATAPRSGEHPVHSALLFAGGALWATLLSSIVWPVWFFLPVRRSVARVFAQLADYAHAIAATAGQPAEAWAALGRTNQRLVRSAIEDARTSIVAMRARRSGESPLGANLRVMVGDAEAQFFDLIALADDVEASGDAGPLEGFADRYRAAHDALLSQRPAVVRPIAAHGRIATRLEQASRASLESAGNLDAELAEPSESPHPGSSHREAIAALRAALSWRSPTFRHSVRVTAAAVVALLIGRAVSPEHSAWVTVTTIAVLQPYPAATIDRAAERVIGTVLGSALTVAILVLVDSPLVLALVMIPLSMASVVSRPRSYRLFVVFLTPVFLLVADGWHASWQTATERVIDATVGGAIALFASALVPSWERRRLPAALGVALDAIAHYVDLAITEIAAGRHRGMALADARRDVGIALEQVESSLERMLAEPASVQHRAEDAVFMVTYFRRLTAAVTAIDAGEVTPDAETLARVRAYVAMVLGAARTFIAIEAPPPAIEPPAVQGPLSRVVHHADLIHRVATHARDQQRPGL
jgi:uncharacterized membrane protein YccC